MNFPTLKKVTIAVLSGLIVAGLVFSAVTNQLTGYRNDYRIDYIAAAKYVNPEPAHGIWGSEETSGGDVTYIQQLSDDVIYIQQLSDVDNVPDIGTHSDFSKQQSAPDQVYDTLTEANTATGTSTFGENPASGASYVNTSANYMYLGVYSSNVTGQVVSVTFYGRGATGGYVKAVICDSSGHILGISDPVSFPATIASYTCTFTNGPIVTAGQTYWIGIIANVAGRLYYYSTTGGNSRTDTTNSYSSPTDPTDATTGTYQWRQMYATVNKLNYQLQLEEQFTNVPYQGATSATLHVVTGAFSGEGLNVEVWNGSSWVNLGSLSANTDNTFNVLSYVTSSNLYIRFHDASNTNDPVQDTWQIDSVYLVIETAEEEAPTIIFQGVNLQGVIIQ